MSKKMIAQHITDIPKPNVGDLAHTGVKAALSAIPVLGSSAAEIFSSIITPPLSKRRDEWVQSIAKKLIILEEKVDGFKIENLSQNQMFITTVLHASQVAIRNHQKEKLEALRNAILNAALPTAPEEDIQLMFLNFIDTLTPWHLRLLKFFENPEEWGRKNNVAYPTWTMGGADSVVEHTFSELKGRRDFYKQICRELSIRGLMDDVPFGSTMTRQGMFAPRIKSFGTQFLKFITSPVDDNTSS